MTIQVVFCFFFPSTLPKDDEINLKMIVSSLEAEKIS